jgi:hypothetical protein
VGIGGPQIVSRIVDDAKSLSSMVPSTRQGLAVPPFHRMCPRLED